MAAKKKGKGRSCRTQLKDSAARAAKQAQSATPGASADEAAVPERKFRLVKALKSREREVEKAKSMIYGALPEIIGGIIKEAIGGNHNAARFLMQFAGIGDFVSLAKAAEKTKAAKAEAAPVPASLNPEEAVESFFHTLGITPPALLPPGVKPGDAGDMDHWMVDGEGKAVSASAENPTPPNEGGMGHPVLSVSDSVSLKSPPPPTEGGMGHPVLSVSDSVSSRSPTPLNEVGMGTQSAATFAR